MRVSQGIPKPDEIILSGASRAWLTKPDARKSAKFISSTFVPFSEHKPRNLIMESVTTATDTAMLRVVMAAVEGLSLYEYYPY